VGAEALVIRGASAGLTTIDGKVSVSGNTAEAPGLFVEGVTVTQGFQAGAAPITTIRASRLLGVDDPALVVTNFGRVDVDGCDIAAEGSAVDVFVTGTDTAGWVYARVWNSYIRGEVDGVTVYSTLDTTRIVLGGNTIRGGSRGIRTWGAGDVELELVNNIVAETDVGIDLKSAALLSHENNAFFGNVTNYAGAALPGPGYVTVDCLLDDQAPPGLAAGSPCRDAGSTDADSPHDFHGTPRGASPDIGAIESQP
jgi:hypothetical protein